MQAIKKLQEHKIFKEDSIVESIIKKNLWGTPVFKKAFLRVKQPQDTDCTEELEKQTAKHIR